MAPEIVSSKLGGELLVAKQGQQQQQEASPTKGAYVTFLAGDGDYVKGVVGLAKGLRKVGAAYPLVVAMLPDVPETHRQLLREQGCLVREIEPVYPPENQTQFAMAYYVINYSKLRIWQFVEYKKMVYLDADIQVYANIDHLFDLPDGHLYAVMDCFCEKTWSHTKQYHIGYCQQCPDRVAWPADDGPPPPRYFNAGMFVHEPSLDTCRRLLDTVQTTPPTPFAEQDFLNSFFRDVYQPIPNNYNLVMAMLWRHPENVHLDHVVVVHYCAAGSKPWRYTGKEENMQRDDIKSLVKRWWDVYNDETLDYQGPPAEQQPEGGAKKPLLAALSGAGEVHYVTAPSAA
uniref:Hexosyltransferase n=1 Tax=Anthurium amnicola TaxID=1678845 RepID=A0A1D1YRC8_9ARAE